MGGGETSGEYKMGHLEVTKAVVIRGKLRPWKNEEKRGVGQVH